MLKLESINYFKNYKSIMIKFKECLQKIEDIDTSSGLCLDVPTRWKSTFFIFKVFLNTNRFFQIFTPS